MLRFIGAAFVFASFAMAGGVLCEREKARLSQCEAFLRLFEYIKNQIHYFLAPTKRIYRDFCDDVLEKTGFLAALREEGAGAYRNNWQEAFEKCAANFCLSSTQAEIVKTFGSHIGKSNEPMQTRNFEYLIKEMENETAKERLLCAKNTKLYRTLGLTVGAMAALLLI